MRFVEPMSTFNFSVKAVGVADQTPLRSCGIICGLLTSASSEGLTPDVGGKKRPPDGQAAVQLEISGNLPEQNHIFEMMIGFCQDLTYFPVP
jgi:hypothetical protein